MSTTGLFDVLAHKVTAMRQYNQGRSASEVEYNVALLIEHKCDNFLVVATAELMTSIEVFMTRDLTTGWPAATHVSIADLPRKPHHLKNRPVDPDR